MKKIVVSLCFLIFSSSLFAKTDGSNNMNFDSLEYDYRDSYTPSGLEANFVFTEHDYLSLISSKIGYEFIPGECDLSNEVSMADGDTIQEHLWEMGYHIGKDGKNREIFLMVEDKKMLVKCP